MSKAKPIPVKLTRAEVSMASHIGCLRQIESLAQGLQDKHDMDPKDGWGIHIEGACGELVVAKTGNLHWDGSVNSFHTSADVGEFHVRTRSRHDYELLVRDDDEDEGIYILVTGYAPNYVVRGWQYGKECKQDQYKKGHGGRKPAYFYPQNKLRDMGDLSDNV